MASVNKVILLGNCGREPEVRYMPSGKAVANISIATTNKWKDKDGTPHEETQWHRVQFFDRLAEIAGEYVKKGSPVYVEGSIKYGKYTDKDGVEKNTVDIVANSLQLLGSKDQSESKPPAPKGNAYADAKGGAPRPAQPSSGFEDMDDSIPF